MTEKLDFIVVTGTRRDSVRLRAALWLLVMDLCGPGDHCKWNGVLIHGGAPGADAWAARLFISHKCYAFPAAWDCLGDCAGPVRNAAMAGAVAEMMRRGLRGKCFAFPDAESKGTWDCVRRMKAVGLEVEVRAIGSGEGKP
jgi:hypothetical protein